MDPVTICNMALGMFGGTRIESIDDDHVADSDETSLCNTYYEPSKLAVFEERAWLFATKFIDLGAAADSPYQTLPLKPPGDVPFGLTSTGGAGEIVRPLVSQFVIPAGVVRVLACDDGSDTFTIEWERNGGFILSEQTAQLLAKVVMKIDDPNLWTPNFQWSVAYKLASIIAGPITQSKAIEGQMIEKYEASLKKAANLDGMQGNTTQKIRTGSESLRNRRF